MAGGFNPRQSWSGEITQFNVWDFPLEEWMVENAAECRSDIIGNVIKWKKDMWIANEVIFLTDWINKMNLKKNNKTCHHCIGLKINSIILRVSLKNSFYYNIHFSRSKLIQLHFFNCVVGTKTRRTNIFFSRTLLTSGFTKLGVIIWVVRWLHQVDT